MRFGSLFAGIGGFDLGFGMDCAWQVEIADHPTQVLETHWPDVERFRDVKEVGKHNLQPVDLVCGGFPCQDVSVAGNRKGLAGERSGLWHEFHRVLEEVRPRWCVIENVPGLLSSNGGRDFATILHGLEELRYLIAWRTLDAQNFGVAQRRRRVFIVGHLADGRAAEVLFEPEGGEGDIEASGEAGAQVAALTRHGIGASGPDDNQAQARHLIVSPPLMGEGHDASEDGRGRKAFVLRMREGKPGGGKGPLLREDQSLALAANNDQIVFDTDQLTSAENRSNPQPGGPSPTLAARDQAPAIAFGNRQGKASEVAETLRSDSHGSVPMVLTERTRREGRTLETQDDLAYALTNPGSGGRTHSRQIAGQFGVRRLTPAECERLQGFPDGWTAELSDSARYRALGNAVCVPVARWIGDRIVTAENRNSLK